MTAPITPSQGDDIAVDPAELWDAYCAETPFGFRTPQGAMAFAVDAIGVPASHATLKARIEVLTAALRSSMTAIDDWLQTYAAELCDPARVREAEQRIGEYGTLSYIAHVQERNRAALQPQRAQP